MTRLVVMFIDLILLEKPVCDLCENSTYSTI